MTCNSKNRPFHLEWVPIHARFGTRAYVFGLPCDMHALFSIIELKRELFLSLLRVILADGRQEATTGTVAEAAN